ncbi:MAG: hypothetical protein Q4E33_03440 [Erysipelotrichaceae bacterium]|nr:hypothetical protein [Erysipelotrichaceae bacterium]
MNQNAIQKLYKSYSKDTRSYLFPNGKNELESITSSVSLICQIPSESIDYDVMKGLADIYVDTCVRKTARDEELDIILDMPKKHCDYVKDINTASKVMAYLVLHSQDTNLVLRDLNDENLNELSTMYLDSFKFMELNEGKENKYLRDEEYGLVKEKPIYTHGQTGTDLYFSTLISDTDEELLYEYKDSLTVEGVEGIVDEYIIRKEDGDDIAATLYLNRYGNSNSNNAPKGFKLKKVDINAALEQSRVNVRKDLQKKTIIEIITLVLVAIVVIWLLVRRH